MALGLLIAAAAAITTTHRVSLSPPGLERKSFEYGVASTQVLVETRLLPVGDIDNVSAPLAAQAVLFAQLMSSEPVLAKVGKIMKIPPSAIVAQQPLLPQGDSVSPEQRADQVASESLNYRLRFQTSRDLPVITVFSQGPTPEKASELADATIQGFTEYIRQSQVSRRVVPARRVTLRRLGAPQAGLVNGSSSKSTAVLAFVAAFAGWCLLVLLLSNVARNWRQVGSAVGRPDGKRSA